LNKKDKKLYEEQMYRASYLAWWNKQQKRGFK